MRNLSHRIVAVDLDDTIFETNSYFLEYSPVVLDGKPMKYVIESLKILKESGFEIVVFTCRMNPEEECNMSYSMEDIERVIRQKLIEFDIPFDRISLYKPIADIYIDDRGFHFKNWKDTIEYLFNLGWVERKIKEE